MYNPFTALPLLPPVTANTLPCSGSPLPAPGHVAILHFRGCQNLCEARSIRTQNPAVSLYRFATAFPGHREHVALQRQPCASAWPCRHTPFRGFQNVHEARPITTQNPSVGLYRFATAFPSHREHVALQRQPFASAWPCRHTPFRGFQNVREARPITTQNPSVGLYRFATAFPGHRTHVALQRQPCATAWPCRHNPFTALPLLPPVTANTLPSSGSPLPAPGHVAILHFRGCQNLCEARSIRTQNPAVSLYRFATAFPSHREHVALQRQPFGSATCSIASALPSHRPVSIGFGLAMRVRSSVGFLTLLPTSLVHRAVQMVRYA